MTHRVSLDRLCSLLLVFLLLGSVACAQKAAPLPAPDWLVDEAGVLAPVRVRLLAQHLREFQESYGIQMVGVIVGDLRGRTAAELAMDIGNAWKVGRGDVNNGVVVLLAPNQQQLAIQIGSGMEWQISDTTADMIRDMMVPLCRTEDYEGAFRIAFEQIMLLNKDIPWNVAFTSVADARKAGKTAVIQIASFEGQVIDIDGDHIDVRTPDGDKVALLPTKHTDLSPTGIQPGKSYRFSGRVALEHPLILMLLGHEPR